MTLNLQKKKISASLEDYLEAIYKTVEEKNSVKAIDVSRRLGVGRSSVTEALNSLAEKELVNYGRYETLSLTPAGEKVAKKIILKHKILYEFLTEMLGIDSVNAEKTACEIEHVISDDILERLMLFIKFNKKYHFNYQNFIDEFNKFCTKELKSEKTV